MKISADELQRVIQILAENLSRQPEINVGEDYYWEIPESARYNPYKKPDELTLGQLSDDWSELRKLLTQDRQPVGLDFVWLASILRKIGWKCSE